MNVGEVEGRNTVQFTGMSVAGEERADENLVWRECDCEERKG